MARPPKLQHLGLPKVAPGERLPRLRTTIESTPANPAGDPNIRAHEAGEAAGKVIGGGLGALVIVALIILMLGPVLWAPLWAGLRAARLAPGPWWPWLAGLAVGLLASLVQALLLVQRSPVLRYPIAVLFAAAWVGGLWLELTSPRHDWVTTAPTLHAPGPWSWALIGIGTVLYAGLYLFVLGPVNKGRWVRRWQLIR